MPSETLRRSQRDDIHIARRSGRQRGCRAALPADPDDATATAIIEILAA
ncbi:MAG TPA: hypothetical protein VFT22_25705 [Kofleriaceae bacterium]|nr:hypothetical protein [Kofleriaceae bacterium]